ncbi:competence damage-inducible protein A [Nocardia otitidiscaviarum]|uniref:Competence damage-inducible protein A n=1 Tax=Nocardia otitidiscaviarum TaxID=1823 RepID=A0A379JH69_9NOCA|nr:CinA family protein [Nocardia otitidiscaviarum]SUD47716.1 competence damage-inducible protein A [Nocardia otitidiscaviarum]
MSDTGELASALARIALRSGRTIAVAESLTCGKISAALGAAPDSAQWLRGGLVAYSTEVKRKVLGVPDVPVVSETAALAMAAGVRSLLDADLAVAVTGVGGPDAQDGEPAGSVWLAVDSVYGSRARHRQFDGPPEDVLARTVETALRMLVEASDPLD